MRTIIKNWKIKTKLSITLIACLIFLLYMIFIAFLGFIWGDKRLIALYDENYISIANLDSININYQEQRVLLQKISVTNKTSENYKSLTDELNKKDTEFTTTLNEIPGTDKIKTLYTGNFNKLKQEILSSNANKLSTELYESDNKINTEMTLLFSGIKENNNNEAIIKLKSSHDKLIQVYIGGSIISIWAIFVIIFNIRYINRRISKPLEQLSDYARDISLGNTNITIPVNSTDEIGVLSQSFNDIIHGIQNQAIVLSTVADGDLSVECNKRSEFDTINISIQNTLSNLKKMFEGIITAAKQVNIGSQQISNAAQALSQGSTEQAASVEELSASVFDVSKRIKKNSDNASQAFSLVSDMGNEVERGNSHMDEMLMAIEEIGESSKEISKIINVINDIAFQTNILALNAAVEAARAGAAGKGFAVVADEVRNLASKSSEAAKQTTVLIERSNKQVENGIIKAKNTAGVLSQIAQKSISCIDLVGEITEASKVQADHIVQITTGVDQISIVIQNNSATAEQCAASSEELSGQADLLEQMINKFKITK